MLFNSIDYILFLPLVVCLHFALPHRFRWMLLLLASYVFYMAWRPEYILLILASTLLDYTAGRLMGRATSPRTRRFWLIASLTGNLGLLFTFKYFNFFRDILGDVLGLAGTPNPMPALDVILPVGISFYTFQTLSYTIEVYKGTQKPEKHLGIFALYVAFFPQLVAGPIERSNNLLPQFREKHSADPDRWTQGLRLILWGMFKKVVVADRLALIVDPVYGKPDTFSGVFLALGTVAFAFQIYCDFSGYSDIAIGSARLLGYNLMTNFRCPYKAQSIGEFWQRWHISLSTWFRDYVYIPLGGNKATITRWCLNILAVFLLSGLWHGANLTFVVWGGLHAAYYLASRCSTGLRERWSTAVGLDQSPRLAAALRRGFIFVIVCLGWVFFRAPDVTTAVHICATLPFGWGELSDPLAWSDMLRQMGLTMAEFGISLCAVAFLITIESMDPDGDFNRIAQRLPLLVRWGLYLLLILLTLNLGVAQDIPFIYFQF